MEMGIELLNIDCMAYMATLKDKEFDLAIVDPPYGIGKFTSDAHTTSEGKRVKNTNGFNREYDWNETIPMQEYFSELERVSCNRIIWGANYYNCFEDRNGAIVWYKGEQTKTISACEIASVTNQTKVSFVHINWQSGFFRKQAEPSGEMIHPCQKPIKLYKWLLKNYAKPGDKILDTHLGSASSAIAAHQMGFDFVGMEIDKDYFDAAVKRYNDAIKQQTLFNYQA